jgi:nicotinate-nucleotide--dimethylbenzimidazole phosphoribosyltransferase
VSIELSELATRVLRPDDDARAAARTRLAELAPVGAFGRLGELAEWLAGVQGQCPTHPLDRVRFIAQAGSAASPLLEASPATPRLVEGFQRIESPDDVNKLPQDGVVGGRAVGRDEIERAFEAGMAVADEEVEGGADLLVVADTGVDSAVAGATAVAVLTGADVASVIGRGTGIDDREWMRRCAAVRDTARLARRALGDGADILDLLSTVGSSDLAALTGLLTQASIQRSPVVLDGLGTAAAALVAHRLSPRTARWLVAAHVSPDPGQAAALDKLRLRPWLDYAISLADGTGALLVVPLLQAAARLLAAEEP